MADNRDQRRAMELYGKHCPRWAREDKHGATLRRMILEAITSEREACARVCETLSGALWDQATNSNSIEAGSVRTLGESDGAKQCAAAIRSRNGEGRKGGPTA